MERILNFKDEYFLLALSKAARISKQRLVYMPCIVNTQWICCNLETLDLLHLMQTGDLHMHNKSEFHLYSTDAVLYRYSNILSGAALWPHILD